MTKHTMGNRVHDFTQNFGALTLQSEFLTTKTARSLLIDIDSNRSDFALSFFARKQMDEFSSSHIIWTDDKTFLFTLCGE